jgi:hypothetical protein
MDSSLSIRRGEAADTDAVLALWRGEGVTPSPTDDREGVRRLLAAPHAALLVAGAGGGVAARSRSTATTRGRWDSGTRSAVPATSGIRPWCAT